MIEKRWSWQERRGATLVQGNVAVTPISRALLWRWPAGGFVWNRPVAVEVSRAGRTERQPIIDLTRRAQIGAIALGILLGWIWRYRAMHLASGKKR